MSMADQGLRGVGGAVLGDEHVTEHADVSF
jgi:hypothetical protein